MGGMSGGGFSPYSGGGSPFGGFGGFGQSFQQPWQPNQYTPPPQNPIQQPQLQGPIQAPQQTPQQPSPLPTHRGGPNPSHGWQSPYRPYSFNQMARTSNPLSAPNPYGNSAFGYRPTWYGHGSYQGGYGGGGGFGGGPLTPPSSSPPIQGPIAQPSRGGPGGGGGGLLDQPPVRQYAQQAYSLPTYRGGGNPMMQPEYRQPSRGGWQQQGVHRY